MKCNTAGTIKIEQMYQFCRCILFVLDSHAPTCKFLLIHACSFRDEIKSSGKFAIRSSFKIARTPSLPRSILNDEFPHPNLLNNTPFHDVSAILNGHLHWTPSLPPILNELRIANFPQLLMSSLIPR